MLTTPNLTLIDTLRETAKRLEAGADYNWCHMGRCNCGHLAQTITRLSPAEIHEMALLKAGDWSTQSVEHCTSTGYTIDHIIETMLELGLTRQDIVHIERLSDQRVLVRIPLERRKVMNHKNREDVVLYMRSFADMLEDELLSTVPNAETLLGNIEYRKHEEKAGPVLAL
ncbi:MAG: hypothetical protein LAT75_02920 [Candidatus Cyclonatronum sp.]|uniref:hypothetical protein n=1 Tax=Cyclonatronum sp. TaxID=3024185 RepID=UPI0025C479F9|nr:hypothetical protein [Cyclonatronum sp.]MCC5933440.1 hypothetical protein [Balneolales bacterium]MCH8485789.1 hypothetical protein [Cyclonatronum sp.]